VVQAEPKEAKAVFAAASIAVVMQWKFNPASSGGKPVAGRVLVLIDFFSTDDEGG
jgi:hypothetical protein